MSGYQKISISGYRENPEFHASFWLKDTNIYVRSSEVFKTPPSCVLLLRGRIKWQKE